jgi:hypothetical protein
MVSCQRHQLSPQHHDDWQKLIPSLWSRNKQCIEWHYTISPMKKKLKRILSACKTKGNVFFYAERCILVKFLLQDHVVNATHYLQTFKNCICNILRGKDHPATQQHMAPHCSSTCEGDSEKQLWTCPHSPYIPDVDPSDHRLFRHVKDQMHSQHYVTS